MQELSGGVCDNYSKLAPTAQLNWETERDGTAIVA